MTTTKPKDRQCWHWWRDRHEYNQNWHQQGRWVSAWHCEPCCMRDAERHARQLHRQLRKMARK